MRAAQQARRIGEEIAVECAVRGMTRQQVADRAGVSWATVTQVELGAPTVGVDTLCAVAEAVGLDLVLRVYPGAPATLRDTGQLAAAEALISQADARWQPQLEVRVGTHGEAIDLVLFGTDEIQAHEIERSLGNFQAQLRRADQKRAALAAQHHRPVRLVLVIEDTKRNRDAVAAHEAAIRTALPGGSRDVLRSVRSGDTLGRDAILWIRPRRFRRGPPGG